MAMLGYYVTTTPRSCLAAFTSNQSGQNKQTNKREATEEKNEEEGKRTREIKTKMCQEKADGEKGGSIVSGRGRRIIRTKQS